jgi:drug/metabolite transporter (DMT)-like permease
MRLPGGWRAQFLVLAAMWGSSFLFIKVLGRHWPALWVAFGRIALGALTLTALSFATPQKLRFDRRIWPHLVVAAILFNAVPFTLFAFGEKHVPSVIAGLWNATTPLWVLSGSLLAFPEEHPTQQRLLGLLIGFAGVLMLLGPWRGLGAGQLQGHIACAGAAVCYGAGFLYTRRHLAGRAVSGVALSAGQLICATAMLAVTLPFTSAPTTHIGLDGLGSLLVLGIAGTGIAYVLNYAIVRAAGATIASTVTYLIPVFSTVLGVIVLGEHLSWNEPVGTLILLSGIAVSQGMPRRALTAASDAA